MSTDAGKDINIVNDILWGCSYMCTTIWGKWGDITCREMTVKKGKF